MDLAERLLVDLGAITATEEAAAATASAARSSSSSSTSSSLHASIGGSGQSNTGTTPIDAMIHMLERVETKVLPTVLSANTEHWLGLAEQHLQRFNESDGSIKTMLGVTSVAQKLMREGATAGGDAFSCVLCRLLSAALQGVCASTSPSNITLLANVLVGMFTVLPAATSGGSLTPLSILPPNNPLIITCPTLVIIIPSTHYSPPFPLCYVSLIFISPTPLIIISPLPVIKIPPSLFYV